MKIWVEVTKFTKKKGGDLLNMVTRETFPRITTCRPFPFSHRRIGNKQYVLNLNSRQPALPKPPEFQSLASFFPTSKKLIGSLLQIFTPTKRKSKKHGYINVKTVKEFEIYGYKWMWIVGANHKRMWLVGANHKSTLQESKIRKIRPFARFDAICTI